MVIFSADIEFKSDCINYLIHVKFYNINDKIIVMKLIIGLGNPGKEYENTRHNIGFLVLDKLKTEISKSKLQIPNEILNNDFQIERKFNAEVLKIGDVMLVRPMTFMNESGTAVSKIASFYKTDSNDIYVIHDDLDLRLGEYKIQKGIGPKLHYGVQSIENKLGNKDFLRVRVGVDNRDAENRILGEKYVLQDFNEDERPIIDKVVDKITIDLIDLIS